jgi:hypothetical protein
MSAPPPALRRAVATDGAWLAVTASPEEVGISAELRALVARKEPNA